MSADAKYPEHEKLKRVKDASQAIGAFLDSLPERGMELGEWAKVGDAPDDGEDDERWDKFVPVNRSIETLLADYFGIDRRKLDDEKRAMLDALRQMNERVPA